MKKRISLMLLLACLFGCVFSGYAQVTTLSENFSGEFPPNGWTTIHVRGNQSWTKLNDAAFVQYDGGGASNYLVTPQIAVSANTMLSFEYAASYPTYTSGTTLTVEISEGGNTDSSDFALLQTIDWANTSLELSLAAYAGKNVYIAFHVVDQDGTGVSVDNVEITASSCPKPTDITVASNSSELTFSWTGAGSSYDLEYTVDTWENATQVECTSPYTISGLPANTAYKYRLRNNCGNDDVSVWIEGTCRTTAIATVIDDELIIDFE